MFVATVPDYLTEHQESSLLKGNNLHPALVGMIERNALQSTISAEKAENQGKAL